MGNEKTEIKRKVPMRMCVACRQMFEKKSLVRISVNADGIVYVDKTGRANGRGAYICKKQDCVDRAIKTHVIERTFGAKNASECLQHIKEESV